MLTTKQLAANRANALKSTGPKSIAGRQKSSQNATRHGLFAQRLAHVDESSPHYAALLSTLTAELQPENPTESELVKQMARASYCQQKLQLTETYAINNAAKATRRFTATLYRLENRYQRQYLKAFRALTNR